jgi:hypothetical protein
MSFLGASQGRSYSARAAATALSTVTARAKHALRYPGERGRDGCFDGAGPLLLRGARPLMLATQRSGSQLVLRAAVAAHPPRMRPR